jgi:hypothetical protein
LLTYILVESEPYLAHGSRAGDKNWATHTADVIAELKSEKDTFCSIIEHLFHKSKSAPADWAVPLCSFLIDRS